MAERKTAKLLNNKKIRKISPETREQIRRLTLMNNAFMNLVFDGNIPCTQEILRVILKKDDLIVKTVQTQKMFQGFHRSVCLDIYAEDSEGTRYNIEIQRSNEGADPRRARFHTGMIDAHSLKAGQNFGELPECYVIFITINDVLGLNKAIYTIHRYIDKILTPFDDGSHIIYINTSAKDDGTEIAKLIHDLRCTDANEMYFPALAARVKFFKDDEEGALKLDDYFEQREAKAVEKAEKRGEKLGKESLVMNLIKMGKLTLEEIAKCSGLTLRRVQSLAKTLQP